MIQSCFEDSIRIWRPGDEARAIANELGCSSFLAALLWIRGVEGGSTSSDSAKWISPDLDRWIDLVDLGRCSGMARDLWNTIPQGGSVVVYGDYDVDGIASTTFMMDLALRRAGRARWYIPHRNKQGYGFHPDVVDMIAKSGYACDMIVVVDCGTQNVEAVERARSYGIPTIIFDHHLARDVIADADALVNPHIDGSDLAQKLCAAGVVWCWAWKNALAPREWLLQKLDVVALATIADCVSLESPVNRAIVRRGIEAMRKAPREGLAALMRGLEMDASMIDSDSLAMKIIPCLNAAGRLALADLAMKIFYPSGNIYEHADALVSLNHMRRDLSSKIIADIERMSGDGARYSHVLFGEDWPPGVLSSVASHICSLRDAPIVLAAPTHKEIIRGTLRVPRGVDAEAVLSSMSDMLVSWGGHRMAAGFSVMKERWIEVREMLEDSLAMAGTRMEPEKEDIICWDPMELDMSVWKDAEKRLGPFGVGNPYPRLFCSQSGPICSEPLGRKGSHIKIHVDGCEFLAFGGEHLRDSSPAGWIYKPRMNYWRSSESLQYVVDKVVMPNAAEADP